MAISSRGCKIIRNIYSQTPCGTIAALGICVVLEILLDHFSLGGGGRARYSIMFYKGATECESKFI
jgi:hypothetical protein